MRSRAYESALMFAAETGQVQVAQLLLDSGAYLEAKNKKGYTALTLAAING